MTSYMCHTATAQVHKTFDLLDKPRGMSEIYEDASELEKLICDCEFENQQYVKLIEKEKQLIEAFEREIEGKNEETKRLQEAIAQLDNDTKHFHKQFTINRDNCENLKKTSQVLTEHVAAMTNQLELSRQKRKLEGEDVIFHREEHRRLFEHYRNLWQNYKAKYESWPKVKALREQQAKEEAAKVIAEQAKVKLDEISRSVDQLQNKKKFGDRNTVIIKIAESYVRRQHKMKEITDMKRREMERREMEKRKKEERQREAAEEHMLETVNNQLKQSHIEDKFPSPDQMETNHTQARENEEVASPMISVFSGRSDEEEMQTGEVHTAITRTEKEEHFEDPRLQDHNQQVARKPQTWLENYQEQNQKQPVKTQEPAPPREPHHAPLQVSQKPVTQQNAPQPPYVAFRNVGQDQGLVDMDATVSIHLASRPDDNHQTFHSKPADHNAQSKEKTSPFLLPSTSHTSSHQNVIGFTNPAFQPSPNIPKFTVPVMPTIPSSHVPSGRRPMLMPQVVTNRPSVSPSSISQTSMRSPIPPVQSPRIQSASLAQQIIYTPTIPCVRSAVTQSMINMPQKMASTTYTRPELSVQVPSIRASTDSSTRASPVVGTVQRPSIRPQMPSMSQTQRVMGQMPGQTVTQRHPPASPQIMTQLSVREAPKIVDAQVPYYSVSMVGKSPQISMTSPTVQTFMRPPVVSDSPVVGPVSNQRLITSQLQGHTQSPSVDQPAGQRQKISPAQQTVPASPRSDGQRGQAVGGQQKDVDARSQTPQSSPVPMHTSPSINSEDVGPTQAQTPEHPEARLLVSEGDVSSPFSLEKHREQLKSINKSPGQPLFTANRRMFNGGKGDNKEQEKSGHFNQVFDKPPTFAMFGGGDGLQFPAFKSTEEKQKGSPADKSGESDFDFGFKMPTFSAEKFVASMFDSPGRAGTEPSDAAASLFGNTSSQDKEGNDSTAFSFNFGSFDSGPKSPSNEASGSSAFSFDLGQEPKEPSFNFNFGAFEGGLKGSSDGQKNQADGSGPTFEEMFCSNNNKDNEGGFSFNFGASSSESAQKFSLF